METSHQASIRTLDNAAQVLRTSNYWRLADEIVTAIAEIERLRAAQGLGPAEASPTPRTTPEPDPGNGRPRAWNDFRYTD